MAYFKARLRGEGSGRRTLSYLTLFASITDALGLRRTGAEENAAGTRTGYVNRLPIIKPGHAAV